jgi:hypothetical protein
VELRDLLRQRGQEQYIEAFGKKAAEFFQY